jgi:hypothetical protein
MYRVPEVQARQEMYSSQNIPLTLDRAYGLQMGAFVH